MVSIGLILALRYCEILQYRIQGSLIMTLTVRRYFVQQVMRMKRRYVIYAMPAECGFIHGARRLQQVSSVSWQVTLYRLQQTLLPSDDCCYVIRKFQSLKTRRHCYWCQTSCSGPSICRQEGQFRKPSGLGNRNNDLLGLNCTTSIL